jgi:arylsulfatase A-like enzyme
MSNKKPNIILITIDSLRADHLGCMGYEKNVSPNIDKLAEESVVFTNAYATGPTTPCSFPSILTSTYPLDYQGPQKIKGPRVLISEVLKEQGYITAAFHSNPYLSNFFGYNQGWDFFEDITFSNSSFSENFFKKKFKKITASTFPQLLFLMMYLRYRFKKKAENELKIKASFLNQLVKDFIRSAKEEKSPFFVWIHYMDVHSPYLSQKSYYSSSKKYSYLELIGDFVSSTLHTYNTRAIRKFLKNNFRKYIKKTLFFYDEAIKCVDYEIGKLLKFFKEENIYQNSIICLTSDHGDEFLEHGEIGHSAKLYNELLYVPLLIKIPKRKNEMVNKKISLINLAPTLCDLAEIKTPPVFKGRSLFKEKEDLIFHQCGYSKEDPYVGMKKLNRYKIACQSDTWKYIFDYGSGEEELYDLSKDRKEQNNLLKFESEILFQMRKRVEKFKEENPPLNKQ